MATERLVREPDNPQLFARIQEQNLLRQYDLLANCIDIGLSKGIEAFDKYTLWSLNAAAAEPSARGDGRCRIGRGHYQAPLRRPLSRNEIAL